MLMRDVSSELYPMLFPKYVKLYFLNYIQFLNKITYKIENGLGYLGSNPC